MKVDLNADLGESFGNYKCGMDEEVIQYVSSVNVACGFHASDPVVMAETVRLAKEKNAAVGAHPGYPDLVGFGRRNMAVSPKEVKAMVQYQIGALQAFCKAAHVGLQHVNRMEPCTIWQLKMRSWHMRSRKAFMRWTAD